VRPSPIFCNRWLIHLSVTFVSCLSRIATVDRSLNRWLKSFSWQSKPTARSLNLKSEIRNLQSNEAWSLPLSIGASFAQSLKEPVPVRVIPGDWFAVVYAF
jgi:hypothetical protein